MKFLIDKMQSQCVSGQCYFQRNLFEIVLSHMLSDWKLSLRSRGWEFEVRSTAVIQLLIELNFLSDFVKETGNFQTDLSIKNFYTKLWHEKLKKTCSLKQKII